MPGNSTDIYTNATSVELNCDMAGYVPPNTHLRWYRNNSLIEDTNRYSTVYRPGRYRAQKGRNATSNSVLSVLIIKSPTLNDTGVYECRIADYNLTGTVYLNVTSLLPTVTCMLVYNTDFVIISIAVVDVPTTLIALFLVIALFAVIILITVIVIVVVVRLRLSSKR